MLQLPLSGMFFTLILHINLVIYSSDLNHFLKKTFFPIWTRTDSFTSPLNSYICFCKSFVGICLSYLTVKLLEAKREYSYFCPARLALQLYMNACWMKKCMLRALCGGTPLETTGKDEGGETMSTFRWSVN